MHVLKVKPLVKYTTGCGVALCLVIMVIQSPNEYWVSKNAQTEYVKFKFEGKRDSPNSLDKVQIEKHPQNNSDESKIPFVKTHRHWLKEIEKVSRPSIQIEEMKRENAAFKQYIKNACVKILTKQELEAPINSWEFFINDEFKLVYCPIFKSASSTWIYNFLLMVGANTKEHGIMSSSPIEFARKHYYPRPKLEFLRNVLKSGNYTSFLIVREPFERILSAYRDKIESTSQHYYDSLRCKMSKASDIFKTDCKPNFSEFVSYVIAEHKAGRILDEHWAPYFTFCSPCQVDFDFVLRFETLSAEEMLLFDKVPELSRRLRESHRVHSSHTAYDDGLMDAYYSSLSFHQMEGLIDIYHKDFKIFDYDYTKYANLVL